MTSGAAMMAVGVYLMLFGREVGISVMHWGGLILATVGYIWSAHVEDEYLYRLRMIENGCNKYHFGE